jgi:sentrin-specific protease 1
MLSCEIKEDSLIISPHVDYHIPYASLWKGLSWKIPSTHHIYKESLKPSHLSIVCWRPFSCHSLLSNVTDTDCGGVEDNTATLCGWKTTPGTQDITTVINDDGKESIVVSDSDDILNSSDVAIHFDNHYTLYHDDLDTLSPHQWLNDQIINAYMKLLMTHIDNGHGLHIASTFFYTKLKRSGFRACLRWFKNVDVCAVEMILIPVHLGNHWSLVSFDVLKQKITYYDSLDIYNENCIQILKQFFTKLFIKHNKKPCKSWKCCYRPKNIPKQANSSDCGVFICQVIIIIHHR